MDIEKLVKDSIKNFNLDTAKLRSIAFAICISDKLNGTNQKELDIDKFVETDSELFWDSIISTLGITPQTRGCGSLPRVQKLRVISDVLSLSVCNQVSDLSLMSKESRKVAQLLGVSLPCLDYADENACYKNLEKVEKYLASSSLDFGDFKFLYKRLCIYDKRIQDIGVVKKPLDTSDILVPTEIYSSVGKKCTNEELVAFLESHKFSMEDYSNYVIDVYCCNLIQVIAKLLNERLVRNEVEFNLILTRLNMYAFDWLPIGTYSLNNYTTRLSVLRQVPCYLNRKVNVVFSEGTAFSEMSILGCICVCYLLNKITVKKDFIHSEIGGLLNECNDNR